MYVCAPRVHQGAISHPSDTFAWSTCTSGYCRMLCNAGEWHTLNQKRTSSPRLQQEPYLTWGKPYLLRKILPHEGLQPKSVSNPARTHMTSYQGKPNLLSPVSPRVLQGTSARRVRCLQCPLGYWGRGIALLSPSTRPHSHVLSPLYIIRSKCIQNPGGAGATLKYSNTAPPHFIPLP